MPTGMCKSLPSAMKDQKTFEVVVQDRGDKKEVVEKLAQRSEARIAELERKKCWKGARANAYEQTDYFDITFAFQRQQVEAKLLRAATLDQSKLTAHFDDIVRDLQELQKFLADSTLFLPTYDIRRAQETLRLLQEQVQASQDALLPKRKFTFRSKQTNRKPLTNGLAIVQPTSLERADSLVVSDPFASADFCGFRHEISQMLVKGREEIQGKDVVLDGLQNCTVRLFGSPSTVFVSDVHDCVVECGPTAGSVLIENCTQGSFALACQQLRVHNTRDSKFSLHITSRTIIEDSRQLTIAPYTLLYEGLEADFKAAGIDRLKNNWASVDDFNWLAAGIPSPNWKIAAEEEQQITGIPPTCRVMAADERLTGGILPTNWPIAVEEDRQAVS